MGKYSLERDKIKVLLLEGVHENAVNHFIQNGYTNVEYMKTALDKDELLKKIADVHILGIRSRTMVTSEIIANAPKLITIGAFCIGTNQVDSKVANSYGIPVFNAPYSNTRSVAELVIGECIMLMRGIPAKNIQTHHGKWNKSAKNSFELRGKTIGIIGYGHIGAQVSILAESFGMNVLYYDVVKKLSLGNSKGVNSIEELLKASDMVTLHVPSTPQTKWMIGEKELELMKKGSVLINLSRGDVVNYKAVYNALKSGKLIGVGADVFPDEPASDDDEFVNELQEFENVILTPHIGGSTLEAQANIGLEVAEKLVNYSNIGSTLGSVNFVNIALQATYSCQRFLHIHKNMPGVLKNINNVFTSRGINIASQYLQTDPEIGYVIIDTERDTDEDIIRQLKEVPGTIKARMLY